jgi:membrane protease YdiL (CAAX protease family)
MSILGFLFLLLVFKIKRVKIKDYVSIKKIDMNQMILFICYGFGFQAVSIISNLAVNRFYNIEKSAERVQGILMSENIFTTIILVIVLAPIIEELLFRGMILKKLDNHINTKLAILIQAMLFSATHFNMFQLVPTFLLGIFLGVCYLKFDNIIAPIIIHMVFNSFAVIIMFIPEMLQVYFLNVVVLSVFASVILSMKKLESVKLNS